MNVWPKNIVFKYDSILYVDNIISHKIGDNLLRNTSIDVGEEELYDIECLFL